MHFPKFWDKATAQGFTCWGWSDSDLREAKDKALNAARALAVRFQNGIHSSKSRDNYGYGTHALREQIVEERKDTLGTQSVVITRNSYGALILNTAHVMFVDIDLPEKADSSSTGGFFSKLFGAKPSPVTEDPLNQAKQKVAEWVGQHQPFGARLYLTKAGLRLLVTHDLFDPSEPRVDGIFSALGTDPLYRRLCQNQLSFRARLTPKPWRCDLEFPPSRWPWETAQAEQLFKDWEQRYAAASEGCATCQFVTQLGSLEVHPQVAEVISLHDQKTKAASGLPLA